MPLQSEKNLEGYLFELLVDNPHELKESGLDKIITTKRWFRQYFISGWYFDLIGSLKKENGQIHFQLIELKNRNLSIQDIDQLIRYEYLLLILLNECEINYSQIDLILIGEWASHIENNYLVSRFPNLYIYDFYSHGNKIMFENQMARFFSFKYPGFNPKLKYESNSGVTMKIEKVPLIEKIQRIQRKEEMCAPHKKLFWIENF